MPNTWISKILAVPWCRYFSIMTAKTLCNESGGSGWWLDGSDSASQSFCQLIPHVASKSLCPTPGTPVERVERDGHFWIQKTSIQSTGMGILPGSARGQYRWEKKKQQWVTHVPPESKQCHWPPGVPLLHQHWVQGSTMRRQVLCTPFSNA